MRRTIFFLVLLILLIASVEAGFECSDGTQPKMDRKELTQGQAKSINGVKIGLTKSDEVAVYKRVEAEILINSESLELINNTVSAELELSGTVYNFSLGGISGSKVTLKMNGNNFTIEEKEYAEVSGIIVYLHELFTDPVLSAKILAGKQKLYLSSDGEASKTFEFESTIYGTTLVVASDSSATIQIDKCVTGDLSLISENPITNVSNQTIINETINNQTIQNETTLNKTIINQTIQNETTICTTEGEIPRSNNYCSESLTIESKKENGQTCSKEYECLEKQCKQNLCSTPNVIARFFSWIKNIFG